MKKGIITLMAVALLIPLATFAQPGPGDGPFCPQGRGMGQGPGQARMGGRGFGDGQPPLGRILMLADELGLSEQQRNQLKQMQVDFKVQMIDREAAVEKTEVQLRSLMMDKNASEAEVGRMIDEVGRQRAEVQKLRYGHRKQMRSVLTADQFDKLQKMRKDRSEHRMGKGMGRGHGKDVGKRQNLPGQGRHSMRGRP